jgi:hypothetical protein
MAREASREELLRDGFWKEMNKLHTAIPCIVVNVHDDFREQLVDVQPSINYMQKDGTATPRPVILGVPVLQQGNGRTALTMPIQAGDTVLCVFSMRAIEIWQESDGKPTDPNNRSKFHEKDAIAITGLFPRKKAVNNPAKRTLSHSTQDTVLAHNIGSANEVEIRFKPDGTMIINSPNKVVVNAPEAEVNSSSSVTVTSPTSTFNGNVVVNGNVNSTGTVTGSVDVLGGGKSLKNHTHSGVQPGGGNTGAPN